MQGRDKAIHDLPSSAGSVRLPLALAEHLPHRGDLHQPWPYQEGTTLPAAGITVGSARAASAMRSTVARGTVRGEQLRRVGVARSQRPGGAGKHRTGLQDPKWCWSGPWSGRVDTPARWCASAALRSPTNGRPPAAMPNWPSGDGAAPSTPAGKARVRTSPRSRCFSWRLSRFSPESVQSRPACGSARSKGAGSPSLPRGYPNGVTGFEPRPGTARPEMITCRPLPSGITPSRAPNRRPTRWFQRRVRRVGGHPQRRPLYAPAETLRSGANRRRLAFAAIHCPLDRRGGRTVGEVHKSLDCLWSTGV